MQNLYRYAVMMLLVFLVAACQKEENKNGLQNNVIKKTLGPHLVGEKIWFSYAIGTSVGTLSSAEAVASVAGAEGTGFEPYSWNTSPAGAEVPVPVTRDLSTNGTVSSATLIDTAAATLRYYYVIPEEARGQNVSFSFNANSSNGENVSRSTESFAISRMDMVKNLEVNDGKACYISIENMKVYTKEEIESGNLSGSVDLVYLYREVDGVSFGHALIAPSAEAYLQGAEIPNGASNNVKIEKQVNIRDQHLSDGQYAVFIDDIDFMNLDMSNAANFVLNFRKDEGSWVETQDGKYRAYIYINDADNTVPGMTISMKRLAIK